MGGKLPPNKCVVGGVVEKSIRAILDKIVIRAGFKSRSELIGLVLSRYAEDIENEHQREES